MADLLQSEEVKTARQILVDLGIVGGSGGLGIFGFLRWKRKRPIRDVGDPDQQGVVVVQTGDGSAAHVHKGALLLTENPRIRKAVEGALAPLGEKGIKSVAFKDNGGTTAQFDEADARDIVASLPAPEIPIVEETEEAPDTITAWLRVYSPVYSEKAEGWRFYYGDHPIYANITNTQIATDAIRRGGALVNDLYKVRMEVTQHQTETGNWRPEYKIIEVLDFQPAPQQTSLFTDGPLG